MKPQTYREALIAFAVQADVSLVGAERCPGSLDRPLRGDLVPTEALRRLLAGSGCRFLSTGTGFAILPPAPPQTASAPPPAPQLSELQVTALKRPQAIDDTPAAVTVLSGDELGRLHVTSAVASAALVPALSATNLGPGRDKLIARGLSDGVFTGRARSMVGTYLDDLPINSDAPAPDLRLSDIDRIEVLRGPQGALYGSGAVGGVYRIVTAAPELEAFHAGGAAAYGATQSGAPSRVYEGYLNLPLARDRLGLRAVAYREVDGGYIDDVNLRRSNMDRTVKEGGRLALVWRLSPDWSLGLKGAVQHLTSNDAQWVSQAASRLRRANLVAEDHHNAISAGALTLAGRWGAVDLRATAGQVRHAYTSHYDASAALDLFGAADAPLGLFSEGRRVRLTLAELVASHGGAGAQWLAGVYVSEVREESPTALSALRTGPGLSPLYQERRADRQDEAALYGEYLIPLGRNWSISAGGRLFALSAHMASEVTPLAPARARRTVRDARSAGVSPKLGLERRVGASDLIYVLASSGYRPGGFNTAGISPLPARRSTYGSDRLDSLEVGAKLTRLGGRLTARGALYLEDWRRIQTDQYLASGLAYTANVGNARLVGVEAEGAYEPAPGWRVIANLMAGQARLSDPNRDVAAKLARGLPGAPPIEIGTGIEMEQPLRGGLRTQASAWLVYTGASRLTFDAGGPTSRAAVRAELSAGLGGDRWRADLVLSNPANDHGDTFAYGNPFSFGQVKQVTPQRPRTLSLVASARF